MVQVGGGGGEHRAAAIVYTIQLVACGNSESGISLGSPLHIGRSGPHAVERERVQVGARGGGDTGYRQSETLIVDRTVGRESDGYWAGE